MHGIPTVIHYHFCTQRIAQFHAHLTDFARVRLVVWQRSRDRLRCLFRPELFLRWLNFAIYTSGDRITRKKAKFWANVINNLIYGYQQMYEHNMLGFDLDNLTRPQYFY
jgi:hypothetical protein